MLDDFFAGQWAAMGSNWQRRQRRRKGLGTWQLVRYAYDFLILVHGTRAHVEALREQVSAVLAPMGLRLSQAKTRIAHLADGIDFLGFHIVWRRKRGTSKWHVYTFIASKPVLALKRKIRALTRRLSHLSYRETLVRINYIQRGWASYFRHAVAKHTFSALQNFIWWRMINWVMRRNRMTWRAIQRWLRTPQGWRPIAFDGVELFPMAKIPVIRYRYRGTTIPAPWPVSADATAPTA